MGRETAALAPGEGPPWLTLLQKWQAPQGMMNAATTLEPTGSLPRAERGKNLGDEAWDGQYRHGAAGSTGLQSCE